MKPLHSRRSFYFTAIGAPLILFFFANACSFRISDEQARADFAKAGVPVQFHDMPYGRRSHLHYVQTGLDTAATLFFVHGSPGSWDAFMRYAMDSSLVNRYRIISVDRPGFGHSNFGHAIHLGAEASALEKLMDSLANGKPYTLIGHSLGGPLVAWIAADKTNEVDNLVVLAGALDPSLEPKEYWRYFVDMSPLRYLLPGAFRPSNTELIYLKKDLYRLKPKLADVRCNVYIFHGDHDMLVDPMNVDYMNKMFVNAREVEDTIFKGENHFIPWTRYKSIKSLLLQLPEQPLEAKANTN